MSTLATFTLEEIREGVAKIQCIREQSDADTRRLLDSIQEHGLDFQCASEFAGIMREAGFEVRDVPWLPGVAIFWGKKL